MCRAFAFAAGLCYLCPMEPMNLLRITRADQTLVEAFVRLMPQLSAACPVPDRAALERVVASPDTALFAVRLPGGIAGVLTVALYETPSGRKAWIEDVVVDAASRGRGIGGMLVRAAIAWARGRGADRVLLTSNPARSEARALYLRLGFRPYETGVFRMDLTEK